MGTAQTEVGGGFLLRYRRYGKVQEQSHDSPASALASVIDLCSPEEGRHHSKGWPLSLRGPNGATVGHALLWDYGEAFAFHADPEPFARLIRTLLGLEEEAGLVHEQVNP